MSQYEEQKEMKAAESSAEPKERMVIALPIGATIGVIGLVLLLYGLLGHVDYSHSANININLWWGLGMIVFGIVMCAGSYISGRKR
ncbi:hypothetical protein [Dictyobacter arantiisoli]|uniref:Uncharacterized protein n=1 Tax=Dictyobacter arantiisoli TaxID=2014874 RepID=A0A5A5TA06_9CHLR|nr:hypothetical protein [Dictyobacter arantiisoli]GCF07819.1 hypothetical protein KDI_13830 [Dictyobacter arantiisoli]